MFYFNIIFIELYLILYWEINVCFLGNAKTWHFPLICRNFGSRIIIAISRLLLELLDISVGTIY